MVYRNWTASFRSSRAVQPCRRQNSERHINPIHRQSIRDPNPQATILHLLRQQQQRSQQCLLRAAFPTLRQQYTLVAQLPARYPRPVAVGIKKSESFSVSRTKPITKNVNMSKRANSASPIKAKKSKMDDIETKVRVRPLCRAKEQPFVPFALTRVLVSLRFMFFPILFLFVGEHLDCIIAFPCGTFS